MNLHNLLSHNLALKNDTLMSQFDLVHIKLEITQLTDYLTLSMS